MWKWRMLACVVLVGIALGGICQGADKQDDYLVISLVGEDDPYFEAGQELQRLRNGRVVVIKPSELDSLIPGLRAVPPKYVAVVLHPATLDENLVRRFLKFATEIDEDPFVDFSYGFITAPSPGTAVALAKAGATESRRRPKLAMLGVAGAAAGKSASSQQQLRLRSSSIPLATHLIAAEDTPDSTTARDVNSPRDDEFIRRAMPLLADHSLLLFAGHGYPSHLVGGPTYRHLAGQRFEGAVVLNIACYTGVTSKWYDRDWGSMQIRQHEVAPGQSFCLEVLKTGVAGYFAYSTPRPSGPGMLGDAVTLATTGVSLGELHRGNANSVVLAHLQQGYDQLHIIESTDRMPIPKNEGTQEILIGMSTGGVLFGDPAHSPFEEQPGEHPVSLKIDVRADAILARVEVAGPLYHFFCNDQVVMWDSKTPSLRLEAIVPLGSRHAADVRLIDSPLGDAPYRLIAATEEHDGQRFLHVKATFPQPSMFQRVRLARGGVAGTFEIKTAGNRTAPVIRHDKSR